jgi:hypothetical protein
MGVVSLTCPNGSRYARLATAFSRSTIAELAQVMAARWTS